MKKSELLKLNKGVYLVTDNFCNYLYTLHKYEQSETMICSIKLRGSLTSASVSIHYDLIKDFDDEYDRYIPRKRLDVNMSIGGLYLRGKGAYNIYSQLHLVSVYNPDTVKEDIKRYKVHNVINLLRYDKRTYRQILLKRY